jgi:thiamine transport system permease protein
VFFTLPVAVLLVRHASPGAVIDVLRDDSMRRVAWFTLWQAVASTVLTLAVGLPVTWALSRHTFRGARLMNGLVTVPFLMPGVVVAAGVLAVMPQRGIAAILWAHVVFNTAVVLRVVSPRWAMVDREMIEAAESLGAPPWRVFTQVSWPAIRAAVINAATLVFVFCFSSFAVIAVLGGVSTRTLETEVFTQAVRLGNIRTATALTVLQTAVVVIALLLSRGNHTDESATTNPPEPLHQRHRTRFHKAPFITALTGTAIVFAPIVAVVIRSLRYDGAWTLAGFRALFDGTLDSVGIDIAACIVTSARFALVTVVIAVPIALLATRRDRATRTEQLTLAPLLVSAVTLGLGIIVTFDANPINWRSSTLMIPVIHAVIALPLAVRIIGPARRAIDPVLYESAEDLGASRFTVWRTVEMPLLRPALARATGISAAVSLGEFGAASFLTRSHSMTIPIAIGQLMGRPGPLFVQAAFALSCLVAATMATIGAINVPRSGR